MYEKVLKSARFMSPNCEYVGSLVPELNLFLLPFFSRRVTSTSFESSPRMRSASVNRWRTMIHLESSGRQVSLTTKRIFLHEI